ncbi:MAG: periplasmic protease [Elusimicrobia bacterium]|nr:MAG: periplasmic protease [Elusimicrobiota bacterium]KAF0157379.1 MAG: periplasmic protease [Elusimicrobiota bacterium]
MKRLNRMVSGIAALAFILPSFARAEDKSIYGDDNRLDYFEAPADMKELARSVVSLWKNEHVRVDGGTARVATANFGEAVGLCPSERFREQPVGAFCSGSLVGEDLVMTAGHCIVDEAQCADTRLVFGYAVTERGKAANTTVPAADVYSCKKIIKRDLDKPPTGTVGLIGAIVGNILDTTGPDYALIQLDRKVTDRRPLPINRGSKVKQGTGVFVIGHPVGLPLKVAGDARVRSSKFMRAHFTADLDTFGGNSGSPVFNVKTKKIEGILVRGGTDFVKSPEGCTVSYSVGQNDGKGEAVTHVSVLKDYIPSFKSAPETSKLVELSPEDTEFEPLERTVSFD